MRRLSRQGKGASRSTACGCGILTSCDVDNAGREQLVFEAANAAPPGDAQVDASAEGGDAV
jgi:hypothetical protein